MNERQRAAADRVRADRSIWRSLVEAVGPDRMDEPGAMGEWTFRDLAGHLAGWRNPRIAQLEAVGRGEESPPPPWPRELDDLDDDDRINDWIRERALAAGIGDAVADYDASFERLARAIEALPEDAATDPRFFRWTDGAAIVDGDWGGHLREHAADVREWLARR